MDKFHSLTLNKIVVLIKVLQYKKSNFNAITSAYFVYVFSISQGDISQVERARDALIKELPHRRDDIQAIYAYLTKEGLKNFQIYSANAPLTDTDIKVFPFVVYSEAKGRAVFDEGDFIKWLIDACNVRFFDNDISYYNGSNFILGKEHFKNFVASSLSIVREFVGIKALCERSALENFIDLFIASNVENLKHVLNYEYIPCKNGIIHLLPDDQTGLYNPSSLKLEAFAPDKASNYCLNANYAPTQKSPIFEEWIDQLSDHDATIRDLLSEMCGVAIYKRSFCKKFFYLYSNPNCGKTTFLNTLEALLSPENVSHIDLKNYKNIKFKMWELKHKLANIKDENSDDGTPYNPASCDYIKNLTGNGSLPYELKGDKNTSNFRPDATLILASNDLPTYADKGVNSRMVIIPLQHEFRTGTAPEYAKNLDVMSAFLSFALDGLCRVLNRDKAKQDLFSKSEKTQWLTDTIKDMGDPIKVFIKTYQGSDIEFLHYILWDPKYLNKGKPPKVVSRIYEEYKKFLKEKDPNNYRRYVFNEMYFYRRIVEYFPDLTDNRCNNTRLAPIYANDLSSMQFNPNMAKRKWAVFSLKKESKDKWESIFARYGLVQPSDDDKDCYVVGGSDVINRQ